MTSLALLGFGLALLAEAQAQDSLPVICGSVTGLETDLDPAFDFRDLAFLWFEPGSTSTRMELATLDAEEGFASTHGSWGGIFDGDFGLEDDLGLGYDPEAEGPVFIAVKPSPAHDLSVDCDRGEVVARLPDTRDLEFGATFLLGESGATYWADQDHDGIAVDDRLDWDEALVDEHLARSADETAADPGELPVGDPRTETLAGQSGTRAFTADPDGQSVRLGHADGSSIEPEDVPFVFGEAFDLLEDGASVRGASWKGETGLGYPLEARYHDLSDCSGWPEVEVTPGVLAVDPSLGRFAFSAGAPDVVPAARSHFYQHWNSNGGLTVVGDRGWISFGESDSVLAVVDIGDPAAMSLVGLAEDGWCYASTEH